MCFDSELKEVQTNVLNRKRSRKMVIFPIAHSYNSPGAVNESQRVVEYQFSLILTTRVVNMLNMKNICKALIFDFSYLDSYREIMRQKVQAVNSNNPKLAIEIHLNSSPKKTAKGFETLYISKKGRKFGEMVHNQISACLPGPDRGLKKRPDLFFLKATTCPALILEPLFLSNQSEVLQLKEGKFIDTLAEKIALGVKHVIEN